MKYTWLFISLDRNFNFLFS